MVCISSNAPEKSVLPRHISSQTLYIFYKNLSDKTGVQPRLYANDKSSLSTAASFGIYDIQVIADKNISKLFQ